MYVQIGRWLHWSLNMQAVQSALVAQAVHMSQRKRKERTVKCFCLATVVSSPWLWTIMSLANNSTSNFHDRRSIWYSTELDMSCPSRWSPVVSTCTLQCHVHRIPPFNCSFISPTNFMSVLDPFTRRTSNTNTWLAIISSIIACSVCRNDFPMAFDHHHHSRKSRSRQRCELRAVTSGNSVSDTLSVRLVIEYLLEYYRVLRGSLSTLNEVYLERRQLTVVLTDSETVVSVVNRITGQ